MTEAQANRYLKKYEKEIFKENIHGTPTYAAVVLHPFIPFEYTIEIGLKTGVNHDYIYDIINNDDKNKLLEELFIKKETIVYLSSNINKDKDLESLFKQDNDLFISKEELKALTFESDTINNISKPLLKSIGFTNKIANDISDSLIYTKSSGDFEKLYEHIENNNCRIPENESKFQKQIEGGMTIKPKDSFNRSGTLGGVFKMKDDNELYALTNEHVLKYGDCSEEKSSVVHKVGNKKCEIGKIYWKMDNQYIDAGIIKLNKNVKLDKFTRCGKIEFKAPIKASIGMSVKKCGKRTEYTEGIINSINATTYDFDELNGKDIFYRHQIMTNYMARPGDSGSILVSKSNHPLGLIFARTKNCTANFANHFEKIFTEQEISEDCNNVISFKKFINIKNQHNE